MAVSIACFQWKDFEFAGELAMDIAENAIKRKWPKSLLLNLNIPPCDFKSMGDLRWTRLSIRHYQEQFSKRQDPRGNTYYWLAGKAVKDLKSAGDGPCEWPSDVAQIESLAPSLTPIQPDLFWRGNLSELPSIEVNHQLVR